MKENADKVRALGEVELGKKLTEGDEQMFRLRFQLSMGQTDGLKKLRSLRRERARILTIQRERETSAAVTAPQTVAASVAKPTKAPAKKAVAKKAVAPKAAAAKPAAKPAGKTSAKAKKE